MNLIYPAICHFEDGGYWCEFPDLDGCFTQGDTLEDALENAREAMELTLEDVFDGEPLPASKTKANESKGLYRIEVDPELSVALQVAAARGKVPQTAIAQKMGMTKQAYQRLESRKANLSVKMLKRIAQSMGKRLEIQFV